VTSTGRPQFDANKIDGAGWKECTTCGHEYHIDSTPDLAKCWQCADADADVYADARRARAALVVAVDKLNAIAAAVLR
jgi:hypothetical protein